ncbi:MAG: methyl-accepting chemotaxis protein [Sterolibacteriaceae bacterium MAG5]|nr:methyl-accepting chemotaxis protein [Candidatus Nitricoxidireducens bremensis]
MNIKTRFYILIGFSALMLIWVGATGLSGINASNGAVASVYNNRLVAIERLGEIRNNQMQMHITLAAARQETDAFEVVAHTDKIGGFIFRIENLLKAYGERTMAPEEKQLFDAFVQARLNFGRTGVMPMIDLLQGEKFAEADTLRKSVMEPAYAKAAAGIDALLKYQVDAAKAEYEEAAAYATKVRIISIGSIVVGLVLSIAAGLVITRAITQGVGKLVEAASGMAEGNLAVRIDLAGGCELSQVAQAFNKMAAEFSAILAQVQQAAARLAGTSAEVSETAATVLQASHDQSGAAAEAAASSDSLNRTIGELVTRSEQAAAAAEQTRGLATQGQEVVNQAASGIRDIAQTFNEAARLVDALGQRSQQIGQIVDVIKEIADQTNLLALNAAIEAARAGEQGRGFAVVADEVRKLAERTANATAEISTMISAIQGETRDTVTNMEAGNRQVGAGLELAEQAGASLQSINDSIRSVAEMIREAAAATHAEEATSREISGRVESIARMAADNSAAVGTTTESTRDLRQLADQLQVLVSRFRLN